MTSTPSTFPPPGPEIGAGGPSVLARRPVLQALMDLPMSVPALDPAADAITKVVKAVEPRWLADVLHGTWLGHPLHPVLAEITLGTWVGAGVLDALALAGLVPDELEDGVEAAAATLVGTGLTTALPTIAAGWTDWSDLRTEQKRLGLVHSAGNYAATALLVASLASRLRGRRRRGRVLSVAAVAVSSLGAALGGHLSYRWAAGMNHTEDVSSRVPEGWHRVAAWDDLALGRPTAGRLGEVPVVVLRTEDGVAVLASACSHLSGPLSDGDVVVEDGQTCLVCPWHGSTFRVADGAVVHGPATSPQPTFAVRVSADGDVLAKLEPLPQR